MLYQFCLISTFGMKICICLFYPKAFHPHQLFSQTKNSFPVQACSIFMASTKSGIPFYFHKWQHSPHFLFPFPSCHFPPPLSVLIEKGPPDRLLRWGSHNWRGSQFLPLCAAHGGGLRRPPKAFDGIRRTHSCIHTPTHPHTSCMASVSL